MSNEKRAPGWLGYIGDYTDPIFLGIIISHYKDPYKPTRIQWKVRSFFFSWLTWCRKVSPGGFLRGSGG